MQQIKWFDRKFNFETQQNIFPSILERLSGTALRLEHKCKFIEPSVSAIRIEGTWTIKENIGHLADLEPLWQGRLQDIVSGQIELRPTDLQNNLTNAARHNEKSMDELIHAFQQVRATTLQELAQIDEATVFKFALHPRLKTPMRTMDLFLFVAEHDDHHLARMTELVKIIGKEK
jgi:uncharacterized damage-inducible protein DinB